MTATLTPEAPVLVTGGAGFLGSHLCERLVREGHSVLCIDDLVTGELRNLDGVIDSPRFAMKYHDVREPLRVEKVHAIFNLACPASPVHYQADPIRTTMTSVLGAYNMLELAREKNVSLLQASTSEVYGDPTVHPQKEGYWGHVNPNGVRACYDEGKRCAESLCFDYHRRHGVRLKVARIFNTYGPRMQINDGRVVSNFIVQALRNQPLTIYGNGRQTRSFCYVDDLIEGFVRLMAAPVDVKGPVNLGNPEEFTVLELAEHVLELTGSRSRMIFLPLPSDDPTQRCPDISIARGALGWQPSVRLRNGLVATIDYFDELLSQQPRRSRRRAARKIASEPGTHTRPSGRQVSHAQR